MILFKWLIAKKQYIDDTFLDGVPRWHPRPIKLHNFPLLILPYIFLYAIIVSQVNAFKKQRRCTDYFNTSQFCSKVFKSSHEEYFGFQRNSSNCK